MVDAEPIIDALAATVVSAAPSDRGRLLFVGWTADGQPAAAPSSDRLSSEAKERLAAFRASGLAPRQVPYSALVPAEYVSTGPAIDFADTHERRAEDQVRYTIVDGAGTQRDVSLSELGILDAIAAARQPFQAATLGSGGELTLETIPLYTLFVGLPGARDGTGLAMLFRPMVAGQTNEPVFRSFVRFTVGRLLVLDESVPRNQRKGYLDVAGKIAGFSPKGGLLETLLVFRRLGFVSFSDDWLRGLDMAGRKAQGQLIRVLRAVGMVDVSDEILDELTDPRPDYDVDRLETDRLVDLAEAMSGVARVALRGR